MSLSADNSSVSVLIFIGSLTLVALLVPTLRTVLITSVRRVFAPLANAIGRVLRVVTKPVGDVLRFLRILPRTGSAQKPAFILGNTVGITGGTVHRAVTGGTETDEAIAQGCDAASLQALLTRHKQLFCTWLDPELPAKELPGELHSHEDYDERSAVEGLAQAQQDFDQAKDFFQNEVPLEVNPLNLYEDSDAAFIVGLFRDSDRHCFYVLNEFRKTINGNVLKLTTIFSTITSIVFIMNVFYVGQVDFLTIFGLSDNIPRQIQVLGREIYAFDELNKIILSLLTCGIGYVVMFLFYQTEYGQFQRNNGRTMTNYLVRYLANINICFNKVQAYAAQAVLQEKEVGEMKRDAGLWLTNLQWLALRAFFIEYYLRNEMFQIKRNSSFYIVLVPLVFVVAIVFLASVLNVEQFNIYDENAGIREFGIGYLAFLVLLAAYSRYLRHSLSFVWESIDKCDWDKFSQMNVQHVIGDVIGAYVTQLDRWRSMMKTRL